MKKIFFLITFVQLISFSLTAQKFEMKINTGTDWTFVPDFYSTVFIANDGLVVPGVIALANSVTVPLISNSVSETEPRMGIFGEVEFGIKLNKKLKLSFAAGLLQMRYTYNTIVNTEGTPVVALKSIDPNYGNTDFTYIQLRPGISTFFFDNKLELQFGLPLNITVKSNYNNRVILYSEDDNGNHADNNIEKVYFESNTKKNTLLYGINLRAAYQITGPLDIFISGQYYYGSIYFKSENIYIQFDGSFLFKTGISWTFCNCGKKQQKHTNQ